MFRVCVCFLGKSPHRICTTALTRVFQSTTGRYVDLSQADTIYALLLGRKYKQAGDVKRDLRVSDKKYERPLSSSSFSRA